ncbi:YwbE family protein [Desulfatitalea alkaliphila]|uniref:YwbE family protein n=1 Tax=Desulfatitalea alkaliphila TaxID=2929485 RepID=A0AA41R5S7_9BACT|nr:YwbE family protein [Desulfatitalea alkaliphila]MCJ8502869.1 YwbE family protein [Desulfatitalea alkaliphila]
MTEQPKNGQYRVHVRTGSTVAVVLKSDQRTGRLTRGIVKDVLTRAARHTRGIKVRLQDGQVGRVREILE